MKIFLDFPNRGELSLKPVPGRTGKDEPSSGTVETSPFVFGEKDAYIDVAEGHTQRNNGKVVHRFKLQLHKEHGSLRLVTLTESRDLPADLLLDAEES